MHRSASQPAVPPGSTWTSRAAAVCEVVGVLVTAIVLGRLVQGALGVDSWKAVQAAMVESGEPDFWRLAWLATVEQIFKYGFAFLIFYALGRWHRDRRLPAYGFTTGGESLARLAGVGVVLWAGMGVVPNLLQALAARFPALGVGADQWSLFPSTWSLGFLAYMAAASFLLVPVVEELYARGYMVTRLAEDYGRGGGLLLSALFFALAHGQYFKAEALSLGMLASIVLGSILAGYVFLRTGSLVPVIVAHALVNVPTPPVAWGQEAVLAAMLLVLVVARRAAREWLAAAFRLLGEGRWAWTLVGALVLAACLLAVATAGERLPLVALGLLVLAVAATGLPRGDRLNYNAGIQRDGSGADSRQSDPEDRIGRL